MNKDLPLCECGCGKPVAKIGNRFIHGHNMRGTTHSVSEETRRKIGDKNRGRIFTAKQKENRLKLQLKGKNNPMFGRHIPEEIRNKMSEKALQEKDPLPDNWEMEECPMSTNKECAQYLGCYITEQVLSKIFKNVKMMPFGNHGFDIICDNGYKVEIKSSATGDKNGYWKFAIRKNDIADYFLLMAFDNRENLNPIHLWLIPGKDINHLTSIDIHKTTLEKWIKYEQPLDKVLTCCNEMR